MTQQKGVSSGFSGFWGDGSDGAVVMDGTNTFAGFTTTTGVAPNLVYTLSRDVFATTFSLSTGKTLNTNGFRVFATISLTYAGALRNDGNNAAGTTPGATNGTSALGYVQGTAGGGSSATVGTVGVSQIVNGMGGAGGAGGAGSGGAGANGGTAATGGGTQLRNAIQAFTGVTMASAKIGSGAGGGGAGGDGAAGGTGGGGAGAMLIASPYIDGTGGTLSAQGGNGSNGAGTNQGGGGGGGGGWIVAIYRTLVTLGTTSVLGGTHGTKTGTGVNGGDGNPGNLIQIQV